MPLPEPSILSGVCVENSLDTTVVANSSTDVEKLGSNVAGVDKCVEINV